MFSLLWRKLTQGYSVYECSRDWARKREIEIQAEAELESTNRLAKEEAFSISHPMKLYLTDQQTAGRGRGENSWSNPKPGDALMISFSFDLEKPAQPIVTPLVGLATYRALRKIFDPKGLGIKAPNDILLNGKKVGGLLVEALQMGQKNRLIVGLGLNVFSAPSDMDSASFLSSACHVRRKKWLQFLDQLNKEMRLASQECLGTHLSDSQRTELLTALNNNPQLSSPYESVSPFADLSSQGQVTSWRDL